MKDDVVDMWFCVVMCLLCTLIGFSVALIFFTKSNIILSEYDWKCKHAVIIDDDPSKTQCVIYKRNDQE